LATPPPPKFMPDVEPVHHIEILISNLLRAGVILSLFIVVMGTGLSFVHHHDYFSSPGELKRIVQSNSDFPHSIKAMMSGLRSLEGRSFVVLGLLMLIATPVMRVAVSIIAFAMQKDSIFVVLTTIVLLLLVLSFFLGKVEG
jgi:uncharacterized membrane protein